MGRICHVPWICHNTCHLCCEVKKILCIGYDFLFFVLLHFLFFSFRLCVMIFPVLISINWTSGIDGNPVRPPSHLLVFSLSLSISLPRAAGS